MKPHKASEVLHMIADGHQGPWEYQTDTGWRDCQKPLTAIGSNSIVRLKPRTIKIGDVEVPAPERVAPGIRSKYWSISPYGVYNEAWVGSKLDENSLKFGRVWLTEEDAQQAFDAITKLLGVG